MLFSFSRQEYSCGRLIQVSFGFFLSTRSTSDLKDLVKRTSCGCFLTKLWIKSHRGSVPQAAHNYLHNLIGKWIDKLQNFLFNRHPSARQRLTPNRRINIASKRWYNPSFPIMSPAYFPSLALLIISLVGLVGAGLPSPIYGVNLGSWYVSFLTCFSTLTYLRKLDRLVLESWMLPQGRLIKQFLYEFSSFINRMVEYGRRTVPRLLYMHRFGIVSLPSFW